LPESLSSSRHRIFQYAKREEFFLKSVEEMEAEVDVEVGRCYFLTREGKAAVLCGIPWW
jgi:hypothetical protein